MAGRALASARSCQACRLGLLQSFAAIAGVSINTTPYPTRSPLAARAQRQRTFHGIGSLRSDNIAQKSEDKIRDEIEELEELAPEEPQENEQSSPSEPVPWYLQVEKPQSIANPFSERQKLPELPADPPPILQPLLEHTSVEIGLDDLALLDLRELDPPPALGANLVMIIGTARSLKHLNVSADRICRWLRSNYQLRPHADGLLGRNELKLKLRRKNKRAKLLNSVGASSSLNNDDGIATGWVCVNVGTVEDGRAPKEEQAQDDSFVGFGKRSGGTKIVLQMLTEERRAELDLESLWGGQLRRALKEQDVEEKQAEDEPEPAVRQFSQASADPPSPGFNIGSSAQMPKVSVSQAQTRGFHTARHLRRDFVDQMFDQDTKKTQEDSEEQGLEYDGLDSASLEPKELASSSNSAEQHPFPLPETIEDQGSGEKPLIRRVDSKKLSQSAAKQERRFRENNTPPEAKESSASARENSASSATLRSLLDHLESLPEQEALASLGQGPKDRGSTAFLKSFYEHFRIDGDPQHQLELFCYAVLLGHPQFYKSHVYGVFEELQQSGLEIPEQAYKHALQALLCRNGAKSTSVRPGGSLEWFSKTDIAMALRVLEDMDVRQHDVLNEDVFILLNEAIGFLVPVRRTNAEAAVSKVETGTYFDVSGAQARLQRVMATFDVQITRQDSIYRMLQLYANQGHWTNFWETWRSVASSLQTRSKDLYEFMFRTIAETRDPKICARTLRTWAPMMERETVPVLLEDGVAEAVYDCLMVAEPQVTKFVHQPRLQNGEWATLYKRCLEGMEGIERRERGSVDSAEVVDDGSAYTHASPAVA